MDCSLPGSSARNSPGKNTGVNSHSLPQGIFPIPGIKPRSPTLQADSLLPSHQGSPNWDNPIISPLLMSQITIIYFYIDFLMVFLTFLAMIYCFDVFYCLFYNFITQWINPFYVLDTFNIVEFVTNILFRVFVPTCRGKAEP